MTALPSYPFKIRYGRQDDPLAEFHLPALERAVGYDRLLGFASSTALATAAAGLPRLILRGGSVRLLCGVRLTDDDVARLGDEASLVATVAGAFARDLAPTDDPVVGGRLEALAWMLAHQHLELRVALPLGDDEVALSEAEARRRFDPEEAVLRDAEGHRLAWSGTPESFWTFATFPRGQRSKHVAEAPSHVRAVVRRFESLWKGDAAGWCTLALPSAACDALLAFCPEQAPRRDPLERVAEAAPARRLLAAAGPIDEGLLLRFLREAPYLPNARDLGIVTSAVRPWPHQLRLVRRVVERYPASFLFCDEVGLGKTIEAGLALRQLAVSGRVRRALVLVPKNVLRQWQEELYEKIALHVPRLVGGQLYDVFDRKVAAAKKTRRRSNPWNAAPMILASSHLARRRERRAELLRAHPWDLVIVDEAHHARRKDFRPGSYRPNKLLELLAGSGGRRGLKDRTRCLYLLTATPMQVHPVEIWDLLRLLGLGGRWGAFEDHFLRFFEELRRPFHDRDWDFLAAMLADGLETAGGFDRSWRRAAVERLGEDAWSTIESLPEAANPADAVLALAPEARQVLDEALRRHTPLRTFVERNTRQLLRRYRMQGLLRAHVPERRPENVWIAFKDDEKALYERIEAYLADFYQRFEAERRGLGFLMTVYRRRLTSSFYAIRKSLERRLAFLRGDDDAPRGGSLFPDDLEPDDLDRDLFDADEGDSPERRRSEQAYLEDFLRELGELGRDSKVERLIDDIAALLGERDKVLVFTQYTDTMDHLREELRAIYGPAVACYSGRGGETWDGEAWALRRKERIKEAFRSGEIRVLLATEAASEGLNLQTCGVLINFDMPWNPMRVEQRIGRVDRIGQAFPEVWIRNYFYADSVEATVYRRLAERIRWFEEVLGRLQPILHRVSGVLERVAMLRGPKRERLLEEQLTALGMELDQNDAPDLGLDPFDPPTDAAPGDDLESPVGLAELEAAFVDAAVCGERFSAAEIKGAYTLSFKGEERLVTFSPELFDRYPNSVELLTWGHPWLDGLLAAAEAPAESDEPGGLGLYRTHSPEPLSLFLYPSGGGAVAVTRLEDLRRAADEPAGAWTGGAERAAVAVFSEARKRRLRALQTAADERRRAQRSALVEAARQVLRRAALVNLAMGQHTSLFEEALPYGFGAQAVAALGQRGAPFAALLELAGGEEIEIRSDDPFFLQVQGRPAEELRRKSKALVTQGKELVARHAILAEGPPRTESEPGGVFERTWFPLVDEAGEDAAAESLPFRVLESSEVRPFENAVPLYDALDDVVARFADGLGDDARPQIDSRRGRRSKRAGPRPEEILQADELQNPADYTWAELLGRTVAQPGLFLARVNGEAMNRRIPSGTWCVFRLAPRGSRDGQVVLARHRGVRDPESGGEATLRIYESRAEAFDDGSWRQRIVLRSTSTDPSFQPIVIQDPEEGTFQILAQVVEIL